MNSPSQELLPCPFCGDEHFTSVDMTSLDEEPPRKWQRIKCNTCGAMAPDTAWNTRAQLLLQREGAAQSPVLSDADIEAAFKGTNFGTRTPMQMLIEGTDSCARGFFNGHTLTGILRKLGLAVKAQSGHHHDRLTELGLRFLKSTAQAQQPTAPGGEVVETQWRRVNKVSGWSSRWYFLDADDDIENVRKNFTSSEWEIETRDLVAAPSPAKEKS